MIQIELRSDFIELHKLLKASGLCSSGAEAKHAISQGLVTVDGETETRKARKVRAGQKVSFNGETVSPKPPPAA